MTAVVAPKFWLSPFDGHSSLEYDTETDSSAPKTHHISVERNYPKIYIFEHIHISFIYVILLMLLVRINDTRPNITAVVAPKIWPSPFDAHSSLEYDTETDSSAPKTHHISVERNYPKIYIYSNIFTYFSFTVYC